MIEKIMKQFFSPSNAHYRLLLLFPILNLVFLSIVILFLKSPKEAILISMGSVSFVVFLIASKKFASLFYYTLLAFNIMIFFVTFRAESLWIKAWSLSMMVTLILGYYLSLEVLEFYQNDEKLSLENKKEKALWKNRFETLRDAHHLQSLTVEEDLNKSKEAIKQKNGQIKALEKLVEVTHKEAAALSKQKHELFDKIKCSNDSRGDEEIKRQNIALLKKVDAFKNLERDITMLQDEKILLVDKISNLQEHNRLLEMGDQSKVVESLQEQVEQLQAALEFNDQTKSAGYSKNQVFKCIEELDFFRADKVLLEEVLLQLKQKLEGPQKPFKWQVWKGDKKEKPIETKKSISMTDLGKGLKI